MPAARRRPRSRPPLVHFLDVGKRKYGDAVLVEIAGKRIVIDGGHPGDHAGSAGHPSIPQQLRSLMRDTAGPINVDLIVVTHAHQDHVGCLPHLVTKGMLVADWALVADPGLGWGRAADDSGAPLSEDARVNAVVAGLREEAMGPATDDHELARFLADARTLEDDYLAMLKALEQGGTKVVRHGRDSPKALLKAFAPTGLKILGPSQAQLVVCAEEIARRTQDAADLVADFAARDDTPDEPTDLYRALVAGPDSDFADAVDRPGPPINLQSIVTSFEFAGAKLLFAGDMQFADPQVSDPVLDAEMAKLRARIKSEAPYSVVKLSHHGSDNAFDPEMLRELGTTPLYGICAGSESEKHPHKSVLRLLDAERDRLGWVRTDRNGLATIELTKKPKVTIAQGRMSDPRPALVDARPPKRPSAEPAGRVTQTVTSQSGDVEVVTRIPPGVSRVTVTIQVEGAGTAAATSAGPADRPREVVLADGRALPPLLFVTSRDALAAHIGEVEADHALGAIEDAGQALYDALPAGTHDPTRAAALVREQVEAHSDVRGVVLIGGSGVVPAHRLDALPKALRARLGPTRDADDFIVWSDDLYGDRDGDLIAELPVSRIPDGNSAELVLTALSAGDASRPIARTGVRNVARPFAEEVYGGLPGAEPLYVSQPTTIDDGPELAGDLTYLMLHGDFVDSTRFWGEDTPQDREAVNLNHIPAPAARVVLTGCCWGALTFDNPAVHALPGRPPGQKAPDASIALSFLQRGATAFVGCTGSHYSPTEEPYGYFGQPMHDAFWNALLAGAAPAQALFEAKVEYVKGFPHGRTTRMFHAIEYKILRQFTCLGLGW